MKTVVTSEQDLESFEGKLPEGAILIHFKMVGVGPNTLNQASYSGSEVCKIVRNQPGFFILSQNGEGLREAMHDLVDRFCNAQEGKE